MSVRFHFSQEDEEGRGDLPRLSEGEDSITEQTHHVIIPSYTSWFNNNRYAQTHIHFISALELFLKCSFPLPISAFTP